MRCNNCGYDGNAPGADRCEKCNYPLSGGGAAAPGLAPLDSPPAGKPLGGTIISAPSTAPSWDGGEAAPLPPIPPLTTPSDPSGGKAEEKKEAPREPIRPKEPSKTVKSDFKKTIDPYSAGPASHNFRLVPFLDGEEDEDQAIDFSGPHQELNRENIDPGNPSVTGKVQATIELVDGEWCIVDNSALKTTFVQAGNPIQLRAGDIIVLGNRRFVFR